jgi:hypothetical protein
MPANAVFAILRIQSVTVCDSVGMRVFRFSGQ